MIKFNVKLPMIKKEVLFLLGNYENLQEFAYLEKGEDRLLKNCLGCCGRAPSGDIIWLNSKKVFEANIFDILSHEVFHCVFSLLKRIGINWSGDKGLEEMCAYMNGFLFSKIKNKLDIALGVKEHNYKTLYNRRIKTKEESK